nr:hypothetical protein Iba_chr07aCG13970 [Ipomoea batatas]
MSGSRSSERTLTYRGDRAIVLSAQSVYYELELFLVYALSARAGHTSRSRTLSGIALGVLGLAVSSGPHVCPVLGTLIRAPCWLMARRAYSRGERSIEQSTIIGPAPLCFRRDQFSASPSLSLSLLPTRATDRISVSSPQHNDATARQRESMLPSQHLPRGSTWVCGLRVRRGNSLDALSVCMEDMAILDCAAYSAA